MDCVAAPTAAQKLDCGGTEKMDPASGEKLLTASVAHPLDDCKEAWLLPALGGSQNR